MRVCRQVKRQCVASESLLAAWKYQSLKEVMTQRKREGKRLQARKKKNLNWLNIPAHETECRSPLFSNKCVRVFFLKKEA